MAPNRRRADDIHVVYRARLGGAAEDRRDSSEVKQDFASPAAVTHRPAALRRQAVNAWSVLRWHQFCASTVLLRMIRPIADVCKRTELPSALAAGAQH